LKSKKLNIYFVFLLIIITIFVSLKIQSYYLSHYHLPLHTQLLIEFITIILLFLFLTKPLVENILSLDNNLKDIIEHTLHELNTPIATIQANLNLLGKNIKDEKSKKRLNRIEKATQNLKQLYQSLEYNIKDKINHKENITFSLNDIVKNSIDKFESLKNSTNIINSLPSNIHINTNQDGFEKLIDNIISNAIKYNKENGYLKIYIIKTKLYFEDSGIGIEPKNLFSIYEKSFQENPKSDGFGLGLHFVKNYCDNNKIEFKIDTQKDIGTTFKLELKNILDDDSRKLLKS